MPSGMYGSSWKTLPDVRALSGDTPGSPEVVGVSPGCPGVVKRPSQMSRRPCQLSGSGRDALQMSRSG